MNSSPAYEAWIERAREKDILEMAGALGARLKKAGAAELIGPCPVCGGIDRFSINTKRRVFNCRGSGQGGDVIEMVRHVRGCDFIAACEEITGEAPPRGDSHRRERDPEIDRERREERRDAELARAKEEAADATRAKSASVEAFEATKSLEGTIVEDYLDLRGVLITGEPGIYDDLRFAANLSYRGYADADAHDTTDLGQFHAMLSAIRDSAGEIIGVHRTYLAAGGTKLKPPGDRSRNAAKKAAGKVGGGLIRLGPVGETLAIGEGIETALSWFVLARRADFGEEFLNATVASAVSLGNLSGGATGSRPHPTIKNRTIYNGDPAPEKPGARLPACVKRLILIGDGDSDPATTYAHLLTAAERHRRAGVEVMVCMAPAGKDMNDVLLSDGAIDPPPVWSFDEFATRARAAMAPPRERRLGRVSVGEIATRGKVTPPPYVIDGWMMESEQSFLAGESQSGKSFLALHAAMCIATGRDVLGRKTKPGLVIYQAGESGFGVTSLRLPAWIQHFGEGIDLSNIPLEIIPARVNLFRPDGNAEEFHQVVKSIQEEWRARGVELKAIIIDTMSKVMSGANENDGRDVGRVLEHGERLSRETGAHVCFVHHLPKNGTGMRGHGSLKGDTDSVVMVRSSETGVRTVAFDKVKDGEAGGKLSFELMQVTIGHRDEDGERITSCVVMPVGEKETARKAEEAKGFSLGVNETPIFAAMMSALKKAGQFATNEMEAAGVPAAMVAVDWDVWREEYRNAATPDADGNPPSNDVIRQHFKRYGQALHHRFDIIGRSGRWLWWTGKRVRGFPATYGDSDNARTDAGQSPDKARTRLEDAMNEESPF